MYASEYPFHNQHEVIFHDLDAMGHINNATCFIYVETVRIKYVVDKLKLRDNKLRSSMVVAEACCTYHAPAYQHELLTIGVGVSRFGNKSFDLLYRIDAPDRLILTGKTIQVSYPKRTFLCRHPTTARIGTAACEVTTARLSP